MMVAETQTRPLTYQDLLETPEDSNCYEIIEGELIVSPSSVPLHQAVVLYLASLLLDRVRRGQLGEVFVAPLDVELNRFNIVQPDIFFIRSDHLDIVGETHVIGAPDLVIEVFSPSTRRRDVIQKAALYAAAGVSEYWQVDAKFHTIALLEFHEGVYVAQPSEEDGSLISRVLGGFQIDPAAFFASLAFGSNTSE